MQAIDRVKLILSETLGVPDSRLQADVALLGSVPELDSMAVIGVISALEQQFGIDIDDDEISARHFATLGSLTAFVQSKLAQ